MTATPIHQSLSIAMHDGSRREHTQAESSPFMTELLAGRLSSPDYVAYLQRLRFVYATLERVVEAQQTHPTVGAVYDPGLERRHRIDADLAYWGPEAGLDILSPAADAYCERLLSVAHDPQAVVAHHYTRYLGDLSGGQAIAALLRRHYGLSRDGLAFYDFPSIPKPKPYKDSYRARLDALDLGHREVVRVVDEVKTAFRLNQALFSELLPGPTS